MVTALLFDLWLLEDERPHPHPAPPTPCPHKARHVAHSSSLPTHPPTLAGSFSLAQPRKESRIHFPGFPFPLPTTHTSLSELDYSLPLSHNPSLHKVRGLAELQ